MDISEAGVAKYHPQELAQRQRRVLTPRFPREVLREPKFLKGVCCGYFPATSASSEQVGEHQLHLPQLQPSLQTSAPFWLFAAWLTVRRSRSRTDLLRYEEGPSLSDGS